MSETHQANHALGNTLVAGSVVIALLATAWMVMNPGSNKKPTPPAPSTQKTPESKDAPTPADAPVNSNTPPAAEGSSDQKKTDEGQKAS